jgi:hypothetical protein
MIKVNLLWDRKTLDESGQLANFDATFNLNSTSSLRGLKEQVLKFVRDNDKIPSLLAFKDISELDVDLDVYKLSASDSREYKYQGIATAKTSFYRDQASTLITQLSEKSEFTVYGDEIYCILDELRDKEDKDISRIGEVVVVNESREKSTCEEIFDRLCWCLNDEVEDRVDRWGQ